MAQETTYRIEPTLLEQYPESIGNLIAEITATSTSLEKSLPPETGDSLADVVRVMNCYYSNLIEGHNTRLKDIEAALKNDLTGGGERRSLQIEARAHIRVQQHIDKLHAHNELPEPASCDFIRELHRKFYQGATTTMLQIGQPPHDFQMIPGEFRSESRQDNAVGLHQPPSSERVNDFMRYFEDRYRFEATGKARRILSMALAHHRFNYIHPFDDGNGRVSRLMSHAMALLAGIGARGLWSISRGLARGLHERSEYKSMMDLADTQREGDLDGRGNLSHRRTIEFVEWFLSVALDQVQFMTTLFDLGGLSLRYKRYVSTHTKLRPESVLVLCDILTRGPLNRGEVARITGLPERTARTVTQSLVFENLVGSSTPKGPISLRFPSQAVPFLFPDLYTAQALV